MKIVVFLLIGFLILMGVGYLLGKYVKPAETVDFGFGSSTGEEHDRSHVTWGGDVVVVEKPVVVLPVVQVFDNYAFATGSIQWANCMGAIRWKRET